MRWCRVEIKAGWKGSMLLLGKGREGLPLKWAHVDFLVSAYSWCSKLQRTSTVKIDVMFVRTNNKLSLLGSWAV